MSVENSPEFKKALKEACNSQWGNWLYGGGFKKSSRRNVEKELERIQRIKQDAQLRADTVKARAEEIRKEAEELRFQQNPMVMRITETLKEKQDTQGKLICPMCGSSDNDGNRLNDKLICSKCMKERKRLIELVPPDKVAKWVDIRKGSLDSVYRKLRGVT